MAHDVFISYSTKDSEIANAICKKLESEGIMCWIAPRDVMPTQQWPGAIISAIKSCQIMILVFSSRSNESAHAIREVMKAATEKKHILTFRIENVDLDPNLEYYLGSLHWVDATKPPLEKHLRQIANVTTQLLENSIKVPLPPAPPGIEEVAEVEEALEEEDEPVKAPGKKTGSKPGAKGMVQKPEQVKVKAAKKVVPVEECEDAGENEPDTAPDYQKIIQVCHLNSEDCSPEAWEVLVGSIDLAGKTGSHFVGTPHLFAGMLRADGGALSRALRRLGIDPVPFRQAFFAQNLSGSGKLPSAIVGDIQFSKNTGEILKLARKIAYLEDREKIVDRDILRAFAQQGGGETGKLLRMAGLATEALASEAFLDNGTLDEKRFAPVARKVLDDALAAARAKGHQMMGNRHLLYGMLNVPDSCLARLLVEQGKDPAAMAKALDSSPLMPVVENPTNVRAVATNMSAGLLAVICRAELSARSNRDQYVGDKALLKELLKDTGSDATRFLAGQGVKFQNGPVDR